MCNMVLIIMDLLTGVVKGAKQKQTAKSNKCKTTLV